MNPLHEEAAGKSHELLRDRQHGIGDESDARRLQHETNRRLRDAIAGAATPATVAGNPNITPQQGGSSSTAIINPVGPDRWHKTNHVTYITVSKSDIADAVADASAFNNITAAYAAAKAIITAGSSTSVVILIEDSATYNESIMMDAPGVWIIGVGFPTIQATTGAFASLNIVASNVRVEHVRVVSVSNTVEAIRSTATVAPVFVDVICETQHNIAALTSNNPLYADQCKFIRTAGDGTVGIVKISAWTAAANTAISYAEFKYCQFISTNVGPTAPAWGRAIHVDWNSVTNANTRYNAVITEHCNIKGSVFCDRWNYEQYHTNIETGADPVNGVCIRLNDDGVNFARVRLDHVDLSSRVNAIVFSGAGPSSVWWSHGIHAQFQGAGTTVASTVGAHNLFAQYISHAATLAGGGVTVSQQFCGTLAVIDNERWYNDPV